MRLTVATVAGRTWQADLAEPVQETRLPTGLRFMRVLHEAELPRDRRSTPLRMPEVRPLFPNHFVPFGKAWQMLSWQLNPLLTANNMTAVYNEALWIANNTGFGNTPRANYFTNENLGAQELRVEALTCGGNLLSILGETIAKTAAGQVPCYVVETLDARRSVPSVDWLRERPWLITEATKLRSDGSLDVARFPQGKQPNGYQPGVRHPLVADPTRYLVVIEKWRMVEWREPTPPDPLTVYRPL